MQKKSRKFKKTCQKCGNTFSVEILEDAEITALKKALKDCQKAIADMLEAGRAEKVRREIRENDLITENNQLRKEIRNLTGGY